MGMSIIIQTNPINRVDNIRKCLRSSFSGNSFDRGLKRFFGVLMKGKKEVVESMRITSSNTNYQENLQARK